MQNRSRKSSNDRSFIGFYADPELKEQAERRAEEEGVSLSEWMRRRLDDVDDMAGKAAATA